jgi:hypothetical protein
MRPNPRAYMACIHKPNTSTLPASMHTHTHTQRSSGVLYTKSGKRQRSGRQRHTSTRHQRSVSSLPCLERGWSVRGLEGERAGGEREREGRGPRARGSDGGSKASSTSVFLMHAPLPSSPALLLFTSTTIINPFSVNCARQRGARASASERERRGLSWGVREVP